MAWRRCVGVLFVACAALQPATAIAEGADSQSLSPSQRYQVLSDIFSTQSTPRAEHELRKAVAAPSYAAVDECVFVYRAQSLEQNDIQRLQEDPAFTKCQKGSSIIGVATSKVLVRDGMPVQELVTVVTVE